VRPGRRARACRGRPTWRRRPGRCRASPSRCRPGPHGVGAGSGQPVQAGPASGEQQQDGADRPGDLPPLPGGPADVGRDEPVTGEPPTGVEHARRAPQLVGGDGGHVDGHRHLPTERDRDVLEVHQVVDRGPAVGDHRERAPDPDPLPDLGDDPLGGQVRVPARRGVDGALHATGPDRLQHGPGHRRPGGVLQRHVCGHLPHRPAVAERRVLPLPVGQVLQQLDEPTALVVDASPDVLGVHGVLQIYGRAAGCGASRDSSSETIVSVGSNSGSGMASWCRVSPVT
jgi:hypothetical protein